MGGKPEQGHSSTSCNENDKSIQSVAPGPSLEPFAMACEDVLPLALSCPGAAVPSCPPRGSATTCLHRGMCPSPSLLQDCFVVFFHWQEGPGTLQKWLSHSERRCLHLRAFILVSPCCSAQDGDPEGGCGAEPPPLLLWPPHSRGSSHLPAALTRSHRVYSSTGLCLLPLI